MNVTPASERRRQLVLLAADLQLALIHHVRPVEPALADAIGRLHRALTAYCASWPANGRARLARRALAGAITKLGEGGDTGGEEPLALLERVAQALDSGAADDRVLAGAGAAAQAKWRATVTWARRVPDTGLCTIDAATVLAIEALRTAAAPEVGERRGAAGS